MALNFNTTPYYDDFNEDKNFHRILFRPGRAVQARELTQSQSLLQDQIKKFGEHLFKDGSRVTGAELFSIGEGSTKNLKLSEQTTVNHINLESTFNGTAINVSNLVGKYITTNTANADLANVKNIYFVHHADAATGSESDVVYVSYLRTTGVASLGGAGNVKTTVANSTNLQVFSTSDLSSSNLITTVESSAAAYGKSKLLGVADGVFFTNGVFVKNSKQVIAVDKYSANSNVSVGFEVLENIIASTADTTLLDPALDSSNYLAPGGDRYKITLNLSKKDLDSSNNSLPSLTTNKYIELVRYRSGQLIKDISGTKYADLGRTLAKRTFDESGDYVVDGLVPKLEVVGNSSNFTLTVGRGKAYVKGYEVDQISPTKISLPRARDTETITGYDLPTYYGNFINIHQSNNAIFNSNVSERVELFSSNTTVDNTTKIAEAYVRNQQYVSGSGYDAVHRLYLFDVKRVANTGGVSLPLSLAKTIKGASDSANCNVHSSSVVSVERIGTVVNASEHLIVSDPTGIHIGDEVFGHNVSSQSAGSTAGAERKVFVKNIQGSNIKLSNASVVSDETSNTYVFQRSTLTDTNFDLGVFEASYDTVASLNDIDYNTRRVFKSVSFTSGQATISTNDGTERFKEAPSSSEKQTFYAIVIRTSSGSQVAGDPVDLSPAGVTFSTSSTPGSADDLTININDGAFGGTADILTTIDVTAAARRTKTANSHFKLFDEIGNTSTEIVRSLGVTDLINVTAIYISNEAGVPASTSNTNVKDFFIVDTGQRDSFYDHATIKLKEGGIGQVNTGGVNVVYNRLQHTGTGHFDANSYPIFENIPSHIRKDGKKIDLRDSVDFRPTRVDDETSNVFSNTSMTFTRNQIVDSRVGSVNTELSYYLGRVDKLVLEPDGDYRLISGESALNNPPTPADDNEAMTLFKFSLPPYTYTTSNVKIDVVKNQRYTMKDIGSLDDRLSRVEYYTSLNLLEQEIVGSTFYDDGEVQLFNNGFVVDDFKGHSIGDVLNPDYKCSIDYDNKVLHPRFKANGTNTSIKTSGLTNTGNVLTVPYTTEVYTSQNVTSGITNINPFNVVSFIGHVELKTDVTNYADFDTRPLVNLNLDGNSDNFQFGVNFAGSKWDEWLALGYNSDTTSYYTYYDTKQKQVKTTDSAAEAGIGKTKTENDKVFYFMKPEAIEFEIFGYRPNSQVFAYLDGVHITTSLRSYNVSTSSFNTSAKYASIFSDDNGFANGIIEVESSTGNHGGFTAGEHEILFVDSPFAANIFSTVAKTRYYSGTPNSRIPKVEPVVSSSPPANPVVNDTSYFVDSSVARETSHSNLQIAGVDPSTISSFKNQIDAAYDSLGRAPDIAGYEYYLTGIQNFLDGEITDPTQLTDPSRLQEYFDESPEKKCILDGKDPLAQTFFVNEFINPKGIFTPGIDIFFSSRDSALPVTLELRNTVNGFPGPDIIKGSQVTLNPDEIVIPSDANIPEATRFTFKKPIFLEPGEYSMVLLTNSSEYNVYIATVGQNRLDTNQTVVGQPYLGSLFKSQNASTWTADQESDLCFCLLKCNFNTTGSFTAVIEPNKNDLPTQYVDNIRIDAPIETFSDKTNVTFNLGLKANGSSDLDSYFSMIPNSNLYLSNRKVFDADTDANLKIVMSTTDTDLSPTFEFDRTRFIFIENLINSSSNTEVASRPETLANDGGATSKYITKKVPLQEGFNADSLRVIIAKNILPGSSVKVFYRVQSDIDNSDFESLPFVEMTKVTEDVVSQSVTEFYDCEYKAENISYIAEDSSFEEFRYFQIKVVLFATNTAKSPTVKNLRAIALT